jgi:uncharacterized protein YcfJ
MAGTLLDWVNAKPEEDTAPATWGDRARQVQRGAYETVSGLAGMGQFVTGGDDDDTFGQIKQWGEAGAQHATEQMTPTARRESEASFLPGGSGPSIWDSNVSLPGALTGKAAGMVPALLSMLVPGTLATRAFGAVAGTLAGGAVNATTMGGQVFNQIEKEIDQAPSDVLAKENPFFARLVERGVSDAEARHALKSEIVGYRPYYMAAIAEATSRLNPAGQLAHGVEGSALTRMGKVGASAAVENTILGATQDALTQGGRTEATGKPFDPHELWSAALESAVMGGATGAPFGLMAGKGAGKTPRKPKDKGVHVGDVDPAHEAALTADETQTEENPQDVPAPPPADGAEPARVDPSVPPEVVAATQARQEPAQAAPSEPAPAPAPAPPAPPAVAPAPAQEPVAGYTTAKGSTYEVHEDGTTTRTKAARTDVGHEGDSGLKPRSAKTVYVSHDGARALAWPPGGGSWRMIDHGDGTLSLATANADGKWGISPSARNIPFTATPEVGRTPVELWRKGEVNGRDAYGEVHFGNPITEVRGPNINAVPAGVGPKGAEVVKTSRAKAKKGKKEPKSLPEQVTPAPVADAPTPDWLTANNQESDRVVDANPAIKQQVADLANSGLVAKQIAAKTGLDVDTVRRVRDQMGIAPLGPMEGPGGAILPREAPKPVPGAGPRWR